MGEGKRAALLLGFGGGDSEEGSESSEGPSLMRAFARAIRDEDYDRAWRALSEAVRHCYDDLASEEEGKGSKGRDPFGSKGRDDDEGDDLAF